MTEKEKPAGESFDLDRLKQLIRLMEKHDLTEVKLEGGDQKWVLRRGGTNNLAPGHSGPLPVAYAPVPQAPGPSEGPPPSGPAEVAPEAPATDEGLVEITSPTVGTFYASPQPGDPPFVKVGDRVSSETVVCIVEAMKVFNQIPAEVSGTIVKALANDGDAVEFGQALFQVKPG